MKPLFPLLFFCVCHFFGHAQLSLPDTIGDRFTTKINTADDKLVGFYSNGIKQYDGNKRKESLHGSWNSWYNNGQLLDSGVMVKGMPDGTWITHYKNRGIQFLRTYSVDKWQQFQNEKSRYHPKRVSMPITKLFQENKDLAEKYTTIINSFCARQNCLRVDAELQQLVDNNSVGEHYHPPFENGLLHGPFANYFPDGNIKDTGSYKDGLPEGIWIKWTDDKQFYWKGHYQHGLKNKEWKLYSSSGKLIRIIFYRKDKHLWRKDIKEGIETDNQILYVP